MLWFNKQNKIALKIKPLTEEGVVKISEGFSVFINTTNGYILTKCAWANKLNNNSKVSTNVIAASLAYGSQWLHILVFFRRILLLLRKFWIMKSTKTKVVSVNVVVCITMIIFIIFSTENVFVGTITTCQLQPICQNCLPVTLARKE